MATESKVRTYILPVADVMTALQNSTGQAPVFGADPKQSTVTIDPTSNPPVIPNAWFITLIGSANVAKQFYDTQSYRVTAAEVATFVNNRAGTSFNQTNIVAVRRHSDNSFFEVQTG